MRRTGPVCVCAPARQAESDGREREATALAGNRQQPAPARPDARAPGTRAGIGLLAVLALAACGPGGGDSPLPAGNDAAEAAASRPNILLIVADDLGYTDLGAFGGEIETPNLDSLARTGVVFPRFYASPMCSPSRAMLLSGMGNHRAGLGNLFEKLADNQRGRPGFEGHLPPRVATLPEVLRSGGYRTYMTGKWHLGEDADNSPAAAGFDRSFALAESGAGHFADMMALSNPGAAIYREDGERVESLPEDFYSTRFFARKLIDYIDADRDDDRPFFAYLAFTAPHFPLQAPDESIARYAGRYENGYDRLHRERLERLAELGFIPADAEAFPPLPAEKPWEALDEEEKRVSARRMQIYAAMIDDMDRYVGEVVDYLKQRGDYENTLLVFLSDNGAEGHWLHQGLEPLARWRERCCDNSYENMGRAGSYVMLGPNWARTATGPWRLFKGFTSEGGLRVPAFLHYPAEVSASGRVEQALTVMDIMPTLLEFAGIEHPAPEFEGRRVLAPQGRSLVPLLRGDVAGGAWQRFSQGWEFLGKRAFHDGDWKIVWQPRQPSWEPWPGGIVTGEWQLYDLARDPAELRDLSEEYPERRAAMIAAWEDFARENGVVHPDRISGY